MITRAEAVAIINRGLDTAVKPKGAWHFGRIEIKELLDAIYGPPDPDNEREHITKSDAPLRD